MMGIDFYSLLLGPAEEGATRPPRTPYQNEQPVVQMEGLKALLSGRAFRPPLKVDPKGTPAPTPAPQEPADLSATFRESLRAVENSVRYGWDDKRKTWKPHPSLEGGNPTLGYGHKLSDEAVKSGEVLIGDRRVNFEKGLSEEDAVALFNQDVVKHTDIVKRSVPEYDQLPQKYQKVLVNIAFNVGRVSETDWPNLFKAMREGDDAGVRREMVTTFKDREGNKRRLEERANMIADSLRLGGKNDS